MAVLTLDKISKRYPGADGLLAVDGLEMEIADGEFMVFVGPSGCGKSTALRMVAGLEDITEGELRIDGDRMNELEPAQRDIAMVFQNYALYPHMTVYRNIAYPLRVQGVKKAEMDRRVRETARILHLEDLLHRRPGQLSGGQRQRVAMGRALVRQPKAFLMDEPLSNLDAKLRVQMRSEITAIQRQLGVTTVYVTHDQVEAMTMGDRVAVLRYGVLQQVATPTELFWNPANVFVASFIGSPPMNLFETDLDRSGVVPVVRLGESSIPVQGDPATAELLSRHVAPTVITGLRPEHLEIVSADSPDAHLRGTVLAVEQLGTEIVCYIDVGLARIDGAPDARRSEEDGDGEGDTSAEEAIGGPQQIEGGLVCRTKTRVVPKIGESLGLVVDTSELRFFDSESRNAL